MNMTSFMPLGNFVKPQPRGQVTISKEVREKLHLTSKTVLNVFEEEGVIVMVPVKVLPDNIKSKEWKSAAKETKQFMVRDTDWTKDNFSTQGYMKAVRYNPLAKLRRKRQSLVE